MPDQPKPYLRIDRIGDELFACEYLYMGEMRTNTTSSRAVIHDIIDMVFPPSASSTDASAAM